MFNTICHEVMENYTKISTEDLPAKQCGELVELGHSLKELFKKVETAEEFLIAYATWRHYDDKPHAQWSAHQSNTMETKVNKLFKALEI